ncbi:aminoacyl-tRNA hydrolase [Kocuria tytonis]|uniref:Peptidyl-tRNA hydrolase n=1 Tax=Kocuria tytonis TaxID=2054280 RepID=A0A495AB72_9MICC|nr:peptidyl-tRNA hydrolase [Kocuria tytonis]RKQ37053.1 peptidyl-tRNA hydrolase [Kocuria tytonis]
MTSEPSEDRDVPWAMQLVVHRDRANPAREVDVAEAAASAVVKLLADERSAPGGPWHEAVRTWRNVQIRKLVRRADGKRWDDVQSLPGVTVVRASTDDDAAAAVRAFVPAPVRPLPKELHKLQVSGTQFPEGGGSRNEDAVVTVEVAPGLGISSGKLAAQCGHAAQLAWEAMPRDVRERWRADDYRVRVVFPTAPEWIAVERPVTVTDAGLTELDGPTETTRAWWG